MPQPDFTIDNQGTVILFTPVSVAATELVQSDAFPLEPWQILGASFGVDHRPAAQLIERLVEEGFTVEEDLLAIPAFLRRQ